MDFSADAYMNEPVQYPALHVTNLKEEGARVTDTYRNMVITRVNGSWFRLAVFEGEYRWLGECDDPGEDGPPHAGCRANCQPVLRRVGCRDHFC